MTAAPFSVRKSLTKAYAPASSNACLEKSHNRLHGHLFTSFF